MLRIFIAVLIIGLAAADVACGQNLAAEFGRVLPGDPIRIQTMTATIEGPFERFAADTLWIAPTAPATAASGISRDSIQTLWTRGGSSGTGAKVGALTGAAFSLVVIVAAESEKLDGDNLGEAYALGSVVMIGAGALLGALLGAPIRSWHRKYP